MTFTDSGTEVHKNPPFKMTNILCILFIINEQESRYSKPHLKGRMGKRGQVFIWSLAFFSSNILPCLVYWIGAVSCMLTTSCIKSICLFWPLKTTRSKALFSLQRPITADLLMEFSVNGMLYLIRVKNSFKRYSLRELKVLEKVDFNEPVGSKYS